MFLSDGQTSENGLISLTQVGEPDEAMKREMAEIDGAMKKMSIQDIVKQDPKFIERYDWLRAWDI